MAFSRIDEVGPGHWRLVIDQVPTVPVRRCFELWCPRDATAEELEAVFVQVTEVLRRRRAKEETPG